MKTLKPGGYAEVLSFLSRDHQAMVKHSNWGTNENITAMFYEGSGPESLLVGFVLMRPSLIFGCILHWKCYMLPVGEAIKCFTMFSLPSARPLPWQKQSTEI